MIIGGGITIGNGITIAGATGGGTTYAAAVLSDSPLFYYRLNDTSGTTAVATVGSNATYSGGYALNQSGFVNAGASVDFNASATPGGKVTTVYTANNVVALTIECWFNAKATGQDLVGFLVTKSEFFATFQQDFPISLQWEPASATLRGLLSRGNDYNIDLTLTSPTLSTGVDYHAALVYRNNGLCELYVNGVQVASANINFVISSNSRPWTIGTPSEVGGGAGQGTFNGRIGEVAVYTSALSSVQINNHYNNRNN